VAKYVLSKRINRGGMAEIFLGRFQGTGGFVKVVCIKRILPHYASDQNFLAMFRDEAHICKRLQHSNIVQVFDFEKVEGAYALIMEFVNGADLRTMLAACERSKIRPPLTCSIYAVAMAARGLHYAHTRKDDITGQPLGIIHRDISPQNLLVGYGGEVKVTDFGIADAESKITDTKPGILKGKFSYMSPEQIMGKQLDGRTDVFALGIVLWEMLAMRRLFQSNTEVETIKKVQAVKFQHDIRKINPGIPEDVLTVLFKALEKDPKKRYQSAEELEKGLLGVLNKIQPDFTSTDLGTFLSQLLADRKAVSLNEIKNVMTEEQKPSAVIKNSENYDAAQPAPSPLNPEKEIEIELDPAFELKTTESKPTPTPARTRVKTHVQSKAPQDIQSSAPQSGFRPQKSRTPQRKIRKTKKPSSFTALVLVGLFLVAAVFGIGYLFYQTSISKTETSLSISSAISPLQVNLNGEPYDGGKYSKAPISINLRQGKNKIELRRDGYKPLLLEQESPFSPSEQNLDITMQKDSRAIRSSVLIIANSGMSNPWVIIDRGFINQALPLKTTEMTLGKSYTITIYPNHPSKENAFACSFTPKSQNSQKPSRLIVSREGGKPSCRLGGY